MKSYMLLGLLLFSTTLTFAQSGRRSAEVFLQIEDRGNFTVYLDQESVGSNTGKFRFYEVVESDPTLSIYQGNKKIFSTSLDVRSDQRLVLGFSVRRGLRVLKNLQIYRNNQYALDQFDEYVGAYNSGIVPPRADQNATSDFENLLIMTSREVFDDKKIEIINAYAGRHYLTTQMVSQLLKQINNDDKKLSLAKNLAPAVTDFQQYYALRDSFTFISTKDNFMAFVNNYRAQRPRVTLRGAAFDQLKNSVKREPFDDERTKLIEAALANTSISTAQVAELLRLYSFEAKALVCAKSIFNWVSDPQNYFRLTEVFKFRNTQDELLVFLADSK